MKLKYLLAALALSASGVVASAQLITFSNRAAFNAQGTIVYNSNFDDFGSGFGLPGDPFTRGEVTYTSGSNVTVGSNTPYTVGIIQPVMCYDQWSPLTGTIGSTTPYNLFGFDAAVTISSPVNITIVTNLNTYQFNGVPLPDGSTTFAFEGFRAIGAGEYFTGFVIATNGSPYAAGITNVAVGTYTGTAVPEPSTYGLFGALALVGLGLVRRLRRQRAA